LGGFMMIKKSVFDSIGGFDEVPSSLEDYLLSKQVKPSKLYHYEQNYIHHTKKIQVKRFVVYVKTNDWFLFS